MPEWVDGWCWEDTVRQCIVAATGNARLPMLESFKGVIEINHRFTCTYSKELNCPHNEMKLKRNSFKTGSRLFWTVTFQFHFAVRTMLCSRVGTAVFRSSLANVSVHGSATVGIRMPLQSRNDIAVIAPLSRNIVPGRSQWTRQRHTNTTLKYTAESAVKSQPTSQANHRKNWNKRANVGIDMRVRNIRNRNVKKWTQLTARIICRKHFNNITFHHSVLFSVPIRQPTQITVSLAVDIQRQAMHNK